MHPGKQGLTLDLLLGNPIANTAVQTDKENENIKFGEGLVVFLILKLGRMDISMLFLLVKEKYSE